MAVQEATAVVCGDGLGFVERLIWINVSLGSSLRLGAVNEQTRPQNEEPSKPGRSSRLEETLRMIEEYANDLRAIIKKLRRLN